MLALLHAAISFASNDAPCPTCAQCPTTPPLPLPLPASPPPPPASPSLPPDYITAKTAFCSSLQQQLTDLTPSLSFYQKRIIANLQIDTTAFDGKLLPWFSLNLQCLNVLYPVTILGVLQAANMTETQLDKLKDIIVSGFSVHMSLGRTNYARQMGVPESSLNDIAWTNDALIGLTMKGPFLPATEVFCERLQDEYDSLMDLAKKMGVRTFPKTVRVVAPNGWMYKFCYMGSETGASGLDLLISSLSSLDWEQHRQDYTSALMRNTTYAAAMVEHTILHWQSLFAAQSNPFNIDNLFDASFEALEPASAMWWAGTA